METKCTNLRTNCTAKGAQNTCNAQFKCFWQCLIQIKNKQVDGKENV